LTTANAIEQPGVDSQRYSEAETNVDDSQRVCFDRQGVSLGWVVGNLTAGVCEKQEQKGAGELSEGGYHIMQDTVWEKAHDGTRVGKAKLALEVVSWVRHSEDKCVAMGLI
jgi:hypothetical protein